MTDRKDFKRVVRARARRTGESYSSALRNIRTAQSDRPAAATSNRNQHKDPFVTITHVIPDVRSTNIDKTVRFYTELIGFNARTERGQVTSFVSASHDNVEISLNRAPALPPGFTIEVSAVADVRALFDRAHDAGARVIDALVDGEFSVLDPSGRRVTIASAGQRPPSPVTGDSTRPITRVIPEVVFEVSGAKRFYGDYLGFAVLGEWPDVVLFEAPTTAGAQVIAGMNLASPNTFDIDVGTPDHLDAIHAAAQGNAVIMGPPQDFPDKGIRCYMLMDPNGVAINVVAPLSSGNRSTCPTAGSA